MAGSARRPPRPTGSEASYGPACENRSPSYGSRGAYDGGPRQSFGLSAHAASGNELGTPSCAAKSRTPVVRPYPAHDGAPQPKGPPTRRRTRNRAPPGRSRRAHRPGRVPAPSSHGRPATQSLSSRAWCKPLPTRDCQLNPTLTHTDGHNSPGEAPEGRAPQHEAESAPGWTGQQRRSTRNRRGVTTVPASVSLGQVMMPTNPEMLQRSAERA